MEWSLYPHGPFGRGFGEGMNSERKATIVTSLYRNVFLPATARFPGPERTHEATLFILRQFQRSDTFINLLRQEFQLFDERLKVDAFGVEFPSPFLLPAGMVKDGVAVPVMAALGVGGIEVGSFTLQKRKGNPRVREEELADGKMIKIRRIERFSDGTVINWMGFPGVGTAKGKHNLETAIQTAGVPVGINLAVSPGLQSMEIKKLDLGESLTLVYQLHPKWITLNISCPNVEEGEDRALKLGEGLELIKYTARMMDVLGNEHNFYVPRLVKIGPDMNYSEISTLVYLAKKFQYQGIVATNTTVDRTGSRERYAYIEKGGLSGPLLFEKALNTVRLVRDIDKELGGDRLALIACGGISSVEDWLQMKEAGADLCQILTGFVLGGPYFWKKLNQEYLGQMQV